MLIHQVMGRCWAIRAEVADAAERMFREQGFAGLRALVEARKEVYAARTSERRKVGGSVAVIPMIGTLTQRGDTVGSSETISTMAISDAIMQAAADDGVSSILLEIDSPGGEVYGVTEAAAKIREARAVKPIVAVANSLAASAAYWLGSQASELLVTPSGDVGSIGVFALHEDRSGLDAASGVKVTLISAGKYKTEGNPHEPLTDEARATLQSVANRHYDMFVRDVAKGRRVSLATVADGFGEGRVVGAREALKLGMVDGIATLEEAAQRAMALAQGGRRSKPSASALVIPTDPDEPEPEEPDDEPEAKVAYGETERRRRELWVLDNPAPKV